MTIDYYTYSDEELLIGSDDFSQELTYVFLQESIGSLSYSGNLHELLDEITAHHELELSDVAVSFFLQSGAVPPPLTIYKDVFVVGIGWKFSAHKSGNSNTHEFIYDFPFRNSERGKINTFTDTNKAQLLNLLEKGSRARLRKNRGTYLFLSAGKDSTAIAIALSKSDLRENIECITYKSEGSNDESEIAADTARKLGFKHRVLDFTETLSDEQKVKFEKYFSSQPFPCSDNATLFYPLVAEKLGSTDGANIIDGMGNDIFLGHIPSRREYQLQILSRYLGLPAAVNQWLRSESRLRKACRTRSEITGLSGISYHDERKIRKGATPVSSYWRSQDFGENYLDLRARIRGFVIDQNIFMQKIRGLTYAYDCNVIFPWADKAVAEYSFEFSESVMFDRAELRNKVFLRDLIKEEIGLDSDSIGKKQFEFSGWKLVDANLDWAYKQIFECSIWEKPEIDKLVKRLAQRASKDVFCRSLVYRIFVFSIWANNCRYIN